MTSNVPGGDCHISTASRACFHYLLSPSTSITGTIYINHHTAPHPLLAIPVHTPLPIPPPLPPLPLGSRFLGKTPSVSGTSLTDLRTTFHLVTSSSISEQLDENGVDRSGGLSMKETHRRVDHWDTFTILRTPFHDHTPIVPPFVFLVRRQETGLGSRVYYYLSRGLHNTHSPTSTFYHFAKIT